MSNQRSTNPLRLLMQSVPVPWVFVLAYVCGVGLEYVLPTPATFKTNEALKLAGAGLFLAGAALAAWGWVAFRRARTTTVPGQASSQLVTWGPYRFSRNPMYVGLNVAYIGEAGMLVQAWPLAMLTLVLAYLNWVVIPVEERKLAEVFGDRYEEYRRDVRRWV
jgi:protein-S-isoprenylcysteine O-methyltransferase Ste14